MTLRSSKQDGKKARSFQVATTRVRTVSGFILFFYVLLHFFNHSMGLISLEAMESVKTGIKGFWRFPPMSIVLYGALAAHFSSALSRIYQRRSLKMSVKEGVQLTLGLMIPLLLVTHVMSTRYASDRYGINDGYANVLIATFVYSPVSGWLNTAGLLAAWLHGCLGLHMWMRVKKWHHPVHLNIGLVFTVLIPSFAVAGYYIEGRNMFARVTDGEFMGKYYEQLNLSSDEVWTWVGQDADFVRTLIIIAIVLVFVARLVRLWIDKRNQQVTIDFVNGPTIQQPIGSSLLEMSLLSGVPHASICGGRGRCSTCRVRILPPGDNIEPASEAEQKVLDRVNAPNEVRLACQVFPRGNLRVVRILPSDTSLAASDSMEPWSTGTERVISVMFADLRDFTRISETRLPFDVVFLINQFSQEMGKEVERYGGRIDKFLGDGFMALFGLKTTAEEGAQNAINAAGAMIEALQNLNEKLAGDLSEPLRMGIGVHSGQVILGEMGYGDARGLTAIGDTVNTASRLEVATKNRKMCFLRILQHYGTCGAKRQGRR